MEKKKRSDTFVRSDANCTLDLSFHMYTIVELVALTPTFYTRNDCTFVSSSLFIVLYYHLVIKYSIYIIFLSNLLKNI